jgi:REP element-mobilizing transposase RayT
MSTRTRAVQRALELKTWGGRRKGAGRPPAGERARAPHDRREPLRPWQPVLVSVRMAPHVWNLRSARSFAVFDAALRGVRARGDFRVVHFSVQGDHLHAVVEADGSRALACGMRALGIRLARGLNRMMGRSGPVFEDRFHAHVLSTPAEVRNALRYVLGNLAKHAAEWGERMGGPWMDPYSSAAPRKVRAAQLAPFTEPAVAEPRTWLLGNGGEVPVRGERRGRAHGQRQGTLGLAG